ncbi:hypothetical protein AAFF_G00087270 [Aldrovandia affinis]|uniref:Uncharacterized protein n=1 Tax=Aldrovandia affinis TaxID=143900 RepID=A0AAD7WC13_9TELE|nr:hypothetical protein AAFF_G00087270 [Aldrovandia affinis]
MAPGARITGKPAGILPQGMSRKGPDQPELKKSPWRPRWTALTDVWLLRAETFTSGDTVAFLRATAGAVCVRVYAPSLAVHACQR